ncbi:MAG: polysaccharide biosynthesis tyrosine autokinase [Bacteroidota bacterium]|nr:polysaccharide biosynthesis tyrosine autokinase [Bacteroidota bacterium]MDP4251014.1 polysaccharide biosynthesis tyrosine autokinase [Bacteroidota bacterium]
MEKSNHNALEKENNGFQQLLTKYLPYWPLFIFLLIVSGAGLYFYLKFTPPIYETKASVLIKDETKGQEDSKMEEVLNVFGTKKIVENELEIFHSNSLISSVVKTLGLYAPMYEEKGWRGLGTTSAYLTSPITVTVPNPNEIDEARNIYFNFSKADSTVQIAGEKYPLDKWVNTAWGPLRFTANPHYYPNTKKTHESVKYYFNLISLDHATNDILGNLMVTAASKQSSIINLSIKDPVAQKSESIISEIVLAYNKASADRKSGVALKTLKFIEDRLKNASKELDSVENSIQKYKDATGVVDISEQSKLYLSSIESNDKQLSNLNLQLSALDEVEKYVKAKNNNGNIVPSTFNINDPSLSKLLNDLSTAEAQYERLKRTTAENNPIMLSLQEEINRIRPNILENINSQRRNIEAGKTTLLESKDRYSAMLNSVPQKERQLVEVSRQHNIKNDIYSFLLQKKEETAYSITSILPDCYIVSNPTTSGDPVSPKKLFLVLLALMAPVTIGILMISLKDIFNGKILYRADIEKLTTFPIIGELIHEKLKKPIVTENAERSFIIEQFRLIRTSLKHQGNPPGNIKRILVSSSIKGDGKSFVSANLAISIGRSGKKVALLELDLHQPTLSEIFEVPKCDGITDYLLGKVKADEIIVPTSKHENVYLIPAGYLVDEPSELLIPDKLEALFKVLDAQFDFLVIDTAPLKVLSDGLTIAPLCNLLLYVIRHNHTPKSHIELLSKDLDAYDIKNVAIIFNDVKNRGIGKYSYGYGYGYGYDIRSTYEEYGKRKKKIS